METVIIWINEFKETQNQNVKFSAEIHKEKLNALAIDEITWDEHRYTREENAIIERYLGQAEKELFKLYRGKTYRGRIKLD